MSFLGDKRAIWWRRQCCQVPKWPSSSSKTEITATLVSACQNWSCHQRLCTFPQQTDLPSRILPGHLQSGAQTTRQEILWKWQVDLGAGESPASQCIRPITVGTDNWTTTQDGQFMGYASRHRSISAWSRSPICARFHYHASKCNCRHADRAAGCGTGDTFSWAFYRQMESYVASWKGGNGKGLWFVQRVHVGVLTGNPYNSHYNQES